MSLKKNHTTRNESTRNTLLISCKSSCKKVHSRDNNMLYSKCFLHNFIAKESTKWSYAKKYSVLLCAVL